MYFYEAEFQYILSDYLALIHRIQEWQKSISPNAQVTDKGFGIAKQFKLTTYRPEFVLEKLEYIDKNMGGLKKFVTVIPVTTEEGNNPSQDETAERKIENERRIKKPIGRPRKR